MSVNSNEVYYKVCRKCELMKPISGFNKHPSNKDRYQSYCRDCYSHYYKHNKEKILLTNNNNNAKYLGFNPDDVTQKPDSCECCGMKKISLHRDHNHQTGRFRGWLCVICNTNDCFGYPKNERCWATHYENIEVRI